MGAVPVWKLADANRKFKRAPRQIFIGKHSRRGSQERGNVSCRYRIGELLTLGLLTRPGGDGTIELDLGYTSPIASQHPIKDRRTTPMPAALNAPRSEALRAAPPDSWIALNEDESRVVAVGSTYEELSKRLDEAGIEDSVIIKTPKSWIPFAV